MSIVIIESTINGAKHNADVIRKTDKCLVVVLENTVIRLVLTRINPKNFYVVNFHGMEFRSTG